MMWKFMFRVTAVTLLCAAVWFSNPQDVQAQPFGCTSSAGNFTAIAIVYAGAPNAVFLIGNAVSLARRPSRVWGITGIITGSVASVAQIFGFFADFSPPCGDSVPIMTGGLIMLTINAATLALGIANTVAADKVRANTPPPKRKKRWLYRPIKRSKPKRALRPKPRRGPRPKSWLDGDRFKDTRKSKYKPIPKKLSCRQVYKFYEGSLADLAHTDDKSAIRNTLLGLEKRYFPCFFTKAKGRRLRKKRRRLLKDLPKTPARAKPRSVPTRAPKAQPPSQPKPKTPPAPTSPGKTFSLQLEL